jgi:hypothetical protein
MGFLRSTIHLAMSLPLLPLGGGPRQGGPLRAAPVGGSTAAPVVARQPGHSAPAGDRVAHPSPSVASGPASTAPPALLTLDPEGVRVVPYRPGEAWPEGKRLHPRVYDPFRNFPRRAIYLSQMMYPRDPRD